MEGDRESPAPSPTPATMGEEEGPPVSSAAPHHGYGLRSREGGQFDRPGRPRGSGEVRSPDPRASIRPPPVIEASRDVEQDETSTKPSGRASSGAGPSTRRLPGNREAGARPRSDTPAEVMMGQTTNTTHDLAALAEAAVAVATHDPSAIATSEPAGPSHAPIIPITTAQTDEASCHPSHLS